MITSVLVHSNVLFIVFSEASNCVLKVLEGSNLSYQVECGGIPNVLMLHQNNGGMDVEGF